MNCQEPILTVFREAAVPWIFLVFAASAIDPMKFDRNKTNPHDYKNIINSQNYVDTRHMSCYDILVRRHIISRHINWRYIRRRYMKKSEPMSESYYYILLCLAKGANHGYGIMQMTEKLSRGDVTIGSGTMYGATSNMMKKGWIKEIMSTEGAERRRLYQLTDTGREALRAEISRLRRMLENAEEV